MKTDALGRVLTTAERREEILDHFERSGLSGAAFAKMHGINYTTFATWVQRRRRERGEYPEAEIPGSKPDPAPENPKLTLAEVVIGEAPATGAGVSPLRVELPGGISLEVGDGAGVRLAAQLVRELGV